MVSTWAHGGIHDDETLEKIVGPGAVRGTDAALILAVFIFWSGFVANVLNTGTDQLMDYWRDMALVGAIILVGLTQPRGARPRRLPFTVRPQPRRITVGDPAHRRRPRPEAEPDDVASIFADTERA